MSRTRKPEPIITSPDLEQWIVKQGMKSEYARNLDSHGKTAWQLGFVQGILREILNDTSGISRRDYRERILEPDISGVDAARIFAEHATKV